MFYNLYAYNINGTNFGTERIRKNRDKIIEKLHKISLKKRFKEIFRECIFVQENNTILCRQIHFVLNSLLMGPLYYKSNDIDYYYIDKGRIYTYYKKSIEYFTEEQLLKIKEISDLFMEQIQIEIATEFIKSYKANTEDD
jgi:hypothetical protein